MKTIFTIVSRFDFLIKQCSDETKPDLFSGFHENPRFSTVFETMVDTCLLVLQLLTLERET
jgi:hypothetical protein